MTIPRTPAPRRDDRGDTPAPRRDDRGDTLALLILWPVLIVAILLLLVHAFIVTNAQSEAEVAASAGLRAAWRSAANSDFTVPEGSTNPADLYLDNPTHPQVVEMVDAAMDAVAKAAATREGWRWWTPGVAEVYSDWCDKVPSERPKRDQSGWVRVVVSGEVFGPLAAVWPDRLDRVYATATGPAVLVSPPQGSPVREVPAGLPLC